MSKGSQAKHIKIAAATHKRLTLLKAEHDLKSLDATILHLLPPTTKTPTITIPDVGYKKSTRTN